MWVRERDVVFLALFIWKEDLLPHVDSRKPSAAHTLLCCYLKNLLHFFLSNCRSSRLQNSQLMETDACFSSCSALRCVAHTCCGTLPLLFRDDPICWSPPCLWKKVLPKVNCVGHELKRTILWSLSSQHKGNNMQASDLSWQNVAHEPNEWEGKACALFLMNVQGFSDQKGVFFHVMSLLHALRSFTRQDRHPTWWGVFGFHVFNSSAASPHLPHSCSSPLLAIC